MSSVPFSTNGLPSSKLGGVKFIILPGVQPETRVVTMVLVGMAELELVELELEATPVLAGVGELIWGDEDGVVTLHS